MTPDELTLTLDLLSPDDLPDDGEEVTAITDHGMFTGDVRYGMIDKEGTPGVVDVVVGGAVSVRWEDVIAWFYFDLEETQ